ncbi:GYF domain-containing protein [Caenorhabditis elegans]|uniref:GYF domain-containing protein n=1 Tax=Caenorhabditis elegans TaxID=6239 RepID=Q966F5_CAEEL|nr:GYF domain-containing protein [Caenorhabditis elegans]CCD67535.1 GYF domain-containing protein [Caenorhabditis elegans]|eukprot:NP_508224.1 Uncharacterized protein CELE_T13G4.1 [Caenorhabditis elegans]
MEESDDELEIFYIDDEDNVQGPYGAKHVLGWYRNGHFHDDHQFKIVDCAQHGELVTYEAYLGDLKSRFGVEAPIPTKMEQFQFRGFLLTPKSNKKPISGGPMDSTSDEVPEETGPTEEKMDENHENDSNVVRKDEPPAHPRKSYIASPVCVSQKKILDQKTKN